MTGRIKPVVLLGTLIALAPGPRSPWTPRRRADDALHNPFRVRAKPTRHSGRRQGRRTRSRHKHGRQALPRQDEGQVRSGPG